MKRIWLSLSLLVLLALGLFWVAGSSPTVADRARPERSLALLSEMVPSNPTASLGLAQDDDFRAALSPALRRRLERLQEATPGVGRESPAGSAEEWRFMLRAYPDKDISLAKIEGARAAHAEKVELARAAGMFAEGAAASTPAWKSLGPTSALYPLSPFRSSFSYVPNAYEAGGRTTAMAIAPKCVPGNCRLWITPAGGGVWRTDNALASTPAWTYLSMSFGINAVSSITLDPNNSNIVWVGTGEANASADSEAGVGLYKSTDGGNTWSGPIGQGSFNARAIGSIAIDPTNSNTMYVATTRAVRGVTSTDAAALTLAPGAPPWGLYKSIDGGNTWSFIFNGATLITGCRNPTNVARDLTPCSPRGVRRVLLDPSDPQILYASAYAKGVWRSRDGGNSWQQIFLPIADPIATSFTERAEIATASLATGATRLYVAIGQIGAPAAGLYRSDDTASGGTPSFVSLSSNDPANPGYGSFAYCTGQCWYDNFVYSPPGNPDMVYLAGSYSYGETGNISNGRGVVLSTDAGQSFTDVTMDATDTLHPNGLHPDQHFLVVNPSNPFQFFESNDGGVMRASGKYTDISSVCANRGLTGSVLTRCQQLLSRVPTVLRGINHGVSSLQFQSISVSPFNSSTLIGGTQDNGTWLTTNTPGQFRQSIFGDGGQAGFDVAKPSFRYFAFFAPQLSVNFSNGATADWNWISDPIVGTGGAFYVPSISDPKVSGWMWVGTSTVYRTKTHGMGTLTLAQFRMQCNLFFGQGPGPCGDWEQLGPSVLTAGGGGVMSVVQRTTADTSTFWAATSTGRLFISQNADAEPAASVTLTRLDTTSALAPNRAITGIAIDPANPNHAFVTYSGYSASTPSTPGHVFDVTYDPTTQTATFVDRSFKLRDLPLTSVAYDSATGDLYASSDFGVYRLRAGKTTWGLAAGGMPNVEVAGLTMAPNARLLYAATHGLGIWVLQLP